MITRAFLVAAFAFALAGCSGGENSSSTPETRPGPRPTVVAEGTCPLTLPNGHTPRDNSAGMNHGNGEIWTVIWPYDLVIATADNVERDGTIDIKWPWYRGVEGQVRITGHRLDGKAGPLTADVSTDFGRSGFQPSTIRFPTAGCWQIIGTVGGTKLTFVTLVVKASAYAAFSK